MNAKCEEERRDNWGKTGLRGDKVHPRDPTYTQAESVQNYSAINMAITSTQNISDISPRTFFLLFYSIIGRILQFYILYHLYTFKIHAYFN